ncbi:MAG: phosphoglucomutase/phosphomannomutase family protein [Dehalococcoidia bacterium]|nr:phosphoglucomutase/phosphomannomutase family protein [Dehalococcoidia bacterium]
MSDTTPIKFGTDGWRAIIAEDFTFENVRACARGTALYLQERGLASRGLVVGYDTRFSSEHFAAAVAEVVAASGVPVYLCERAAPTPVVSYSIVAQKAGGAAIITASHNPGIWNGYKYKPEYAGSASPEVVARLEQLIAAARAGGPIPRMPLSEAEASGRVRRIDPEGPYMEHVARLVDLERIRKAGLRVEVDPMYGAGAGYLRKLLAHDASGLAGGATRVHELHGERNPIFPGMRQPEPIADNLHDLCKAVVRRKADVGLATDGDADRVGMVDENGVFLTSLQVFALLALYMLEVRGERGAIVKSVTTTSMLYKLAQLYNVPIFETPVGFKYIGPIMEREKALIGGEESGGFGFRGHIPERDGVLASLFLLDLMVRTGKSPAKLIEYLYGKVGPHHYKRIDLPFDATRRDSVVRRVSDSRPSALDGVKVATTDTTDGFRFVLEDGAWLLIRFSGTEPLLRIYGEGPSPERVERLLDAGRKMTGV